MMRFLTVYAAVLMMCAVAEAGTVYSSYLNGFEPFAVDSCSYIVDHRLRTENSGSVDRLNLAPFVDEGECTFSISVRLANINNKEGSRYSYTDEATGKRHKTASPKWGVVWNYVDSLNYYTLLLCCSDSGHHDLLDHRFMTAEVIEVVGGEATTIGEVTLDEGVNLSRGDNLVKITFDGNATTVAIGERHPKPIFQFEGIDYSRPWQYGYLVGSGACVDVERIVARVKHDTTHDLATTWTESSIEEYLSTSSDLLEGYWVYLDRNLDDSRARLGGRYTVAIVGNGDGYDIIYIAGAKVNAVQWQAGMLKGQLQPTPFVGNYNLIWYDSLKAPMSEDDYASLDAQSGILTFHFPIHKSLMRFYKCVNK